MTPEEFVAKWSRIQQKEMAVSQSHFNDVCRLAQPAPRRYGCWSGDTCDRMVKKRTLTNLYNGLVNYRQTVKSGQLFNQTEFEKVTRKSASRAEIQELDDIHTTLDHAVLDAYGWPHRRNYGTVSGA